MSSPSTPVDLLDLKMLPAWASEPAQPNAYADFAGEESDRFDRRAPRRDRNRDGDRQRRAPRDRKSHDRREERRPPGRGARDERRIHPVREPQPLPQVDVRFLPHPPVLNSVVAQIKSGSVAYSVFALARLFLDKPERYDVRLTAKEEQPLHQLGEKGPVATNRRILENDAFASLVEEFFTIETTQTEPIKGNFSNVARCRLSGTLLGPTNYHSYQPQLRNLYEQRFSRRMSFADYQRQIDIVSDPAVVEQWKEQARNVVKYTTKNEEPPVTFGSPAEAERHFRQNHLPGLLRTVTELTIDGVPSRQLSDRGLNRAIEDAWVRETRSPSRMMQELAAGLRQAGLNIFRHRRGMLFVSPIRARAFRHENDAVSATIRAVLDKLSATPGMNRKQLADELTLVEGGDAAAVERARLALASDLRWLISEGYVIEFNDGSLDLPRAKKPEQPAPLAVVASDAEESSSPQDADVSVTVEMTHEPTVTDQSPAPAEPLSERSA